MVYATIDDGLITVVASNLEGQSNYRTIEELQSNLDPDMFWRVHRSYLGEHPPDQGSDSVVQIQLPAPHGRQEADRDPGEPRANQAAAGAVEAVSNRYLEDLQVGEKVLTASVTLRRGGDARLLAPLRSSAHAHRSGHARRIDRQRMAHCGRGDAAGCRRQAAGRSAVLGLGVDGIQWPLPVRPGDTIQVEMEVLEIRPSKSQPTHGIVKTPIDGAESAWRSGLRRDSELLGAATAGMKAD